MDRADVLLGLAVAMGGGNASDAINQTARSRANASCQIARNIDSATKAQLWLMGIVCEFKGTGLLCDAYLPLNWKIKPTDHYMYSHIVDDKGRCRAQLGLKSTDNWASVVIYTRLQPTYTMDKWVLKNAPEEAVPIIQDSDGKVLWRGTPDKKRNEKDFDSTDRARRNAIYLLSLLYPNWRKEEAYWDLETFEFPPNESKAPTGIWYKHRCEIFRDYEGRESVDSGYGGPELYQNDQEAIAATEETLKYHIPHYKCVKYTVYKLKDKNDHGEKVGSGTLQAPRPKPQRFGFGREGCYTDWNSPFERKRYDR